MVLAVVSRISEHSNVSAGLISVVLVYSCEWCICMMYYSERENDLRSRLCVTEILRKGAKNKK